MAFMLPLAMLQILAFATSALGGGPAVLTPPPVVLAPQRATFFSAGLLQVVAPESEMWAVWGPSGR